MWCCFVLLVCLFFVGCFGFFVVGGVCFFFFVGFFGGVCYFCFGGVFCSFGLWFVWVSFCKLHGFLVCLTVAAEHSKPPFCLEHICAAWKNIALSLLSLFIFNQILFLEPLLTDYIFYSLSNPFYCSLHFSSFYLHLSLNAVVKRGSCITWSSLVLN